MFRSFSCYNVSYRLNWVITVRKAIHRDPTKTTDESEPAAHVGRQAREEAPRAAKADKPATWLFASSSPTASGALALGPPLTASNQPTYPLLLSPVPQIRTTS